MDPGGPIAGGPDLGPGLGVGRRQRDDARGTGGAAGLVDALDPLRGHAGIAAEGRPLLQRPPQLLLAGERQPGQVVKRHPSADACLGELAGVQGRVRTDVRELPLPGGAGPSQDIGTAGRLARPVPDPVVAALAAANSAQGHDHTL